MTLVNSHHNLSNTVCKVNPFGTEINNSFKGKVGCPEYSQETQGKRGINSLFGVSGTIIMVTKGLMNVSMKASATTNIYQKDLEVFLLFLHFEFKHYINTSEYIQPFYF